MVSGLHFLSQVVIGKMRIVVNVACSVLRVLFALDGEKK